MPRLSLRRPESPQPLRHGPQSLRGSLEAKLSGAHLAGLRRPRVSCSRRRSEWLRRRDATSAFTQGRIPLIGRQSSVRSRAPKRGLAYDGSSQQADAWRPTAEGGPSFTPLSCEFLESEPSDPATCVNMENTDQCGAGGAYMPNASLSSTRPVMLLNHAFPSPAREGCFCASVCCNVPVRA